MDEDKVQQQAREADEQSTQRRAAILGLPYLDLRPIEGELNLLEDVLDVDTMHKNRLIPLVAGNDSEPWQFGITTQTPQSILKEITDRYSAQAQNTVFHLISQSGFKVMMERYDPPVKVTYDDIRIANDGDSETIDQVSQTLKVWGVTRYSTTSSPRQINWARVIFTLKTSAMVFAFVYVLTERFTRLRPLIKIATVSL